MQKTLVMKFGGTSVGSVDALINANLAMQEIIAYYKDRIEKQ